MKRVLALFVVSFLPVLSCGGTSEMPEPTALAPAAAARLDAEPTAAAPAPEEIVAAPLEPTLPAGTFRDVHALCAQQMADVGPLLEEARRENRERYEADDIKIAPACKEDPTAMRGVRVSLASPYLDAKAVTYETGAATKTSIVVRTSEGWTNVGTPIVSSFHDDPGCPSILRDAGLVEIRVDGGHLVVVDKADRGWIDESSIVYERARTCSFSACTEPVTIGANVVPWAKDGGKEKRVFTTTYTIDELGGIVPAATWDGDLQQ